MKGGSLGCIFKINGRGNMTWHQVMAFGLRWQSKAATALLTEEPQLSS